MKSKKELDVEVVDEEKSSRRNKVLLRIGIGVLILAGVVGLLLAFVPKVVDVFNNYTVVSVVRSAAESTKKLREGYVIANYLDSPCESQSYLTVLLENGSYTEHPVDSDGNIITDTSFDSAVSDYIVFDWIDGETMYTVNTSYTGTGEGSLWIKMPDSYADTSSNRESMYLDWLLDYAFDWKSEGTRKINLGGVSADADIYSFALSAERVSELMGLDNYALYESLKEEAEDKKDTSVVNLSDTYLKELGISLTYSEGQCEIGIVDGAVRYFKLDAGGLGARMSLIRTLIEEDVGVRETPDFSNCGVYYDDFKIFADYVEESGSLGAAIDGLRAKETETDVKE